MGESFSVECNSCSKTLKVPVKLIGRAGKCPGCGKSIKIERSQPPQSKRPRAKVPADVSSDQDADPTSNQDDDPVIEELDLTKNWRKTPPKGIPKPPRNADTSRLAQLLAYAIATAMLVTAVYFGFTAIPEINTGGETSLETDFKGLLAVGLPLLAFGLIGLAWESGNAAILHKLQKTKSGKLRLLKWRRSWRIGPQLEIVEFDNPIPIQVIWRQNGVNAAGGFSMTVQLANSSSLAKRGAREELIATDMHGPTTSDKRKLSRLQKFTNLPIEESR